MIKVGIYGPVEQSSPLRKQLLRLLLRHPDVDLRTVAAPGASGASLTELYPVYTGETELRLESTPDLDDLDVLFVIDEANLTEAIRSKAESDEDFRLIVLGEAPELRRNPWPGMVYGFAEYNRKALVRGARMAVSPSAPALLVETALFPLAKHWHMPQGAVEGTLAMPYALSGEIDEALALLKTVQSDFEGPLKVTKVDEAPYERMDLKLSMPLPAAMDEISSSYETAYEDHSFAYVIPGRDGIDEDLRGSNKCLMQVWEDNGRLNIHASADRLTRGNAGNAVHLMDLLFGLHERTGLSI